MLDKLELAIRRYQAINADTSEAMSAIQAEQISEWIDRQVCDVVSELLTKPAFRQPARWCLDALCGQAGAEAGAAVSAVDAALVRTARLLNEYADAHPDLWQNESVDSPVDSGSQQMAWLADRPWRHLASPLDYFYPTAAYNLRDADDVQHGRFLPYLHRTLRIPGDFVSRCMRIRIDDWRQDIQRFFVCCDSARKNAGEEQTPEWETIQHSLGQLDERIRTLRQHCLESPKTRLRDSCVALVQVYAGYRQHADLSWLGDVSQMVQGVGDMRHRVERQYQWEVPERIAEALHDVACLLREDQPPDAMIEEMKSKYRLVLVEGLRQGYLDGISINVAEDVVWSGRNDLRWELLWVLAERARTRQSVDRTDLSNTRAMEEQEPPTAKAIRDRRSDLKKLISAAMNVLIVDAGSGTYRLELDPEQICLLGWVEHESLETISPLATRHSSLA